jgi:hypothetical protein
MRLVKADRDGCGLEPVTAAFAAAAGFGSVRFTPALDVSLVIGLEGFYENWWQLFRQRCAGSATSRTSAT